MFICSCQTFTQRLSEVLMVLHILDFSSLESESIVCASKLGVKVDLSKFFNLKTEKSYDCLLLFSTERNKASSVFTS